MITDKESDTLKKMITEHGVGEVLKEVVYIMIDLEIGTEEIAKIF